MPQRNELHPERNPKSTRPSGKRSILLRSRRLSCNECGSEMGIPGLLDYNIKEMDEQYRKAEDIITVEDINRLMKLYNIGKAPLLALGFGEVTITATLPDRCQSKEYSDIMLHALASASYMKELLDQNREKIGETAYKKPILPRPSWKTSMWLSRWSCWQ